MGDISRAFIIHPVFKTREILIRDADACLQEACGLALAIDLYIADAQIVSIAKPRPSTLMGKGKLEEVGQMIALAEVDITIVNYELTPVQQRNMEKAWKCKVIDRTALILEIFGARARTHEGKLQVELAALEYQKSRLVRSWTHLERQRGGVGFMGGPGESQIEIDRRLIRERITKLKKQLEQVKRTRELHRKVRRQTPYPVVALVGYTNAGKSTLFNYITGANVLSMDKLFATLDPTMRALTLPQGTKIILSDTVGFVSELPTQLVAAFRATLEEVLESDILLHVRDISHTDTQAQKLDVEAVLRNLMQVETLGDHVIEIHNKVDLLNQEQQEILLDNNIFGVSALTGQGIEVMLKSIETQINARYYTQSEYQLPLHDGKSIAWLHSHGKVLSQTTDDNYIYVHVQLSPENISRFEQIYNPKTKA